MITRYLVSYDIADPERLRKVYAVVRAQAHRIQDSVYEALMSEKERVLFEHRLRRVIHEKEDQVMFVNLGNAERKELPEVTTLGQGYQPQVRGSVVL